MRSNHVPVAVRLLARISKLSERIEEAWLTRRGNPYRFCKHCQITTPQLSVNADRHHRGCPIQGLDKQIEHYRALLLERRGPARGSWLDLAEQQEQIAKAWTLRAPFQPTPRLCAAMRGDAEDAVAQARDFREAHEAGAPLVPALFAMLSFARAGD